MAGENGDHKEPVGRLLISIVHLLYGVILAELGMLHAGPKLTYLCTKRLKRPLFLHPTTDVPHFRQDWLDRRPAG